MTNPKQQLVELILSYADVTGSHVAVEQGERSVNYPELRERVRERASLLAALGAPHTFVALERRKTPEFIVDFLAVLLIDGIVIPLDPDLPPERRARFLDLMQPRFLLGDSDIARRTVRSETPQRATDEAGWVYFTSGSTGMPKPVLGSAVGARSFVDWFIPEFSVRPSDRFAFLTDVSFEASLRDIFGPLAAGATVVLPTSDDTATPQTTVTWLAGAEISVVTVIPSVARGWLGRDWTVCPTVRAAFFVGEPLSRDVLAGWQQTFPATAIRVNSYGATESGQGTIYRRVAPDEAITERVPAGRPVPGTRFCLVQPDAVLDAELVRQTLSRPASSGEIVIVSRACSLGYLGLPDENRARFAHLGGGVTGYRTGDLGTVDENGELVVIGRADAEVKINGVRVHPAEVTRALQDQPAIADGFVIATRTGETAYLTGYVVPAEGCPLSIPKLRRGLMDTLPVAMIPTEFVELAELPRTRTGKVDRAALAGLTEQAPPAADAPSFGEVAATIRDIAVGIEEHALLPAHPTGLEALLDAMSEDRVPADALDTGALSGGERAGRVTFGR